ncbi:hypothetical protein [Streptomyces sp. NPDC053048]
MSRRPRATRPWTDWGDTTQTLVVGLGVVSACCAVIWLAVREGPSHF